MGQWDDDSRDGFAHLGELALSKSRVSSDSEFFYGKDSEASQPKPACKRMRKDGGGKTICMYLGDETRGDVSTHGFWKKGAHCNF